MGGCGPVENDSGHGGPLHLLRKAGALPAMLLLSVVQWIILGFHLPVFSALPAWFWVPTNKSPGTLPVLLLIVVSAAAALYAALGRFSFLAARPVSRTMARLAILIFSAYCIQMGFGFTEGRGIDGIRDRMVTTGHAEFARTAVTGIGLGEVVTEYQALLDTKTLGEYAHSKPPGTLLLYMVTARLCGATNPALSERARLDILTTFSAWVWPFVSCLALIPLFLLCRLYAPTEVALCACLLYFSVSAVNLVTLHADQVFYPTFFVGSIYLMAVSVIKRSVLVGVAAGTSVFLSAYCSFPLATSLLFGVLLSVPVLLDEDRSERRRSLAVWLTVAATLVGLFLAFRFFLGFDMIARYQDAMAFHVAWKKWSPDWRRVLFYGVKTMTEFFFWLGAPMTVLVLAGMRQSIGHIEYRRMAPSTAMAVGLAILLVCLAFFGRTAGEVARLWLFLVPVACIVAANRLRQSSRRHAAALTTMVFALQLITVYFMKRFQDFW